MGDLVPICAFPNSNELDLFGSHYEEKYSPLDTGPLYASPSGVRVHTIQALNLYLIGIVMGGLYTRH